MNALGTSDLWSPLPAGASAALEPQLPAIADEVVAAIGREVPQYQRPIEGSFGRGLRRGVEEALRRFLALFGTDASEPDPRREIYVALGEGELRAGRSMDALLSAYRVGARISWRRLAAAGEAAGLEPAVLYRLAEAIFAYIDAISAESVEGYAQAQAQEAGEAERRRRALARLLIQDPPADPAAVEAGAAAAGWAPPRTLAAVYVEADAAPGLTGRLGLGAIAAPLEPGVCILVPDPDGPGHRQEIEAALNGLVAGLGPTRPWREAGLSALRARAAHRLADAGGEGRLIVAADHHLELLLAADPALAHDIATARLAALEDESPASRERLTQTLSAWLEQQGRTERVATALDVHPQTVRYRVARLRELLGDALDQPDARLELALALRAEGP